MFARCKRAQAVTDSSSPLPRGVWGVLATPFDAQLRLDLGSLATEVGFFVERGVTGLVALGVFGEAARLTDDEQDEVVRCVCRSAGDIPVVAGVSGLAPGDVLDQANRLMAATGGKVAALMVKVNAQDADAVADQLEAVRNATGAGIVLQDYPAESGVSVTPAVLVQVVNAGVGVVAVKSESPPTAAAIAELTAALDVPVFGGLGGVGLLDELAAGAAGAMTGFSHPEGLWAAISAYRDQGFSAAHAAYAPWLPLANFEGQPRIGLALRKEILRRRGAITHAAVRPPAAAVPAALLPQLERHLEHTPLARQR